MINQDARGPWSIDRANRWYGEQPWLIGSNYVPANAANQLDMWQADSFAPELIDRELGWAASRLGMNTMRVFLIDVLWSADPAGFRARIHRFLDIAASHAIRPLFVLFDSCWGPDPQVGAQPCPDSGVHNAGWVQSPGHRALTDRASRPRLKAYVDEVVASFSNDRRVLGWDLWNEPCNPGNPHRINPLAGAKEAAVAEMLPLTFAWARAQSPIQPLTSGLWQHDDWSPQAPLSVVETVQLAQSDVLSFHDYGNTDQFLRRVAQLKAYGRPVLCTEWLARSVGSTIDAILPSARRAHVAMFNWGLVTGRTQTTLPWDSWLAPYSTAPDAWFHDLLHGDGTPFCPVEAALIRALATMPS